VHPSCCQRVDAAMKCAAAQELGVYLYIIKGLTAYAAHYGKAAGPFVAELNRRCVRPGASARA